MWKYGIAGALALGMVQTAKGETDYAAMLTGSAEANPVLAIDWAQGDAPLKLVDDHFFDKGSWVAILAPAAAVGDDVGDLYMARAGIGYYFSEGWSINLEAVGASVDARDGSDANFAGGFDLLLRWHFWHEDRWSAYLDGGAGIIHFDEDFPKQGTQFNFTPQVGVGFTYELNDEALLMAGVRFQHISNADTEGRENNPGYDAALIYAGLMLPF